MAIQSKVSSSTNADSRRRRSSLPFVVSAMALFLGDSNVVNAGYLRRKTSSNDGLLQQQDEFRQDNKMPLPGHAAMKRLHKRRFYARYEGQEGRRLVQELCGSQAIVEDLDDTDYTLLQDQDDTVSHSCFQQLQESSAIAWVEEDYPVKAFSIEETDIPDTKSVGVEDTKESWGIASIQADQLEMGKHDVKVCVIDTGIASQHPDFANSKLSGVDRLDRRNPWYWNQDRVGHGTHVGGIIAASSMNGYGVKGVGDFSLLIVRGLGDDGQGFESDIWKATQVCIDNGADVINM